MKTIDIPINLIENNTGQINGVPPNPRIQDESKVALLMKSISEDPEMLLYRALMVYEVGGVYVSIGGNMRLKALKKLGYEKAPCIVIPKDTPKEKLSNYIIKDNSSFGEWDYDELLKSWDTSTLQGWDISIPDFEIKHEKRAGWNKGSETSESLCDMKSNISWHSKSDFSFISCFKKSDEGYPLSLIKSNFDNVALFADAAINVITRTIGLANKNGWAIATTPKRRHKECNFSEAVCLNISEKMAIQFYADAITAKNRQRINPNFHLVKDIKEDNIIIFDDILTTGSTLTAVKRLLSTKNCFFIVGINNN